MTSVIRPWAVPSRDRKLPIRRAVRGECLVQLGQLAGDNGIALAEDVRHVGERAGQALSRIQRRSGWWNGRKRSRAVLRRRFRGRKPAKKISRLGVPEIVSAPNRRAPRQRIDRYACRLGSFDELVTGIRDERRAGIADQRKARPVFQSLQQFRPHRSRIVVVIDKERAA